MELLIPDEAVDDGSQLDVNPPEIEQSGTSDVLNVNLEENSTSESGYLTLDELEAKLESDPWLRDARIKGSVRLIGEALAYLVENIRHIDFSGILKDVQQTSDMAYSRLVRYIIKYTSGDRPQEDLKGIESDTNAGTLGSADQFVDIVGNLLAEVDINASTLKNATVDDLMTELTQGRQVIVLPDSGELQEGAVESGEAVIQFTGIDRSDSDNPQIIAKGGIDPNDAEQIYTLSELRNTWIDSQFHYIAMESQSDSTVSAETSQETAIISVKDLSEAERREALSWMGRVDCDVKTGVDVRDRTIMASAVATK